MNYTLMDTIIHCFWYLVVGIQYRVTQVVSTFWDVVKTMVTQWTWWHTAAIMIPIIPAHTVGDLIGHGLISTAFQVLSGIWLLTIADTIYEETVDV